MTLDPRVTCQSATQLHGVAQLQQWRGKEGLDTWMVQNIYRERATRQSVVKGEA